MAGQETGPSFFTSDDVLKNSGPCFLYVKQLILQQDTVTCWSFFLIVFASSLCWLNVQSLQIGMSLSITPILSVGLCLRLVFFSAVKELQNPLPVKIVFKWNLRGPDVTFQWRMALRYRALLLHMGPNSVYMMVTLVIFGIWISNLGTHRAKAFCCDSHH